MLGGGAGAGAPSWMPYSEFSWSHPSVPWPWDKASAIAAYPEKYLMWPVKVTGYITKKGQVTEQSSLVVVKLSAFIDC